MFVRKLRVWRIGEDSIATAVPVAWLDSFAMRSFTNDARFDDTLPIADGELEAGLHVPLPALHSALEAWCRRKGRLAASERLEILEQERNGLHPTER